MSSSIDVSKLSVEEVSAALCNFTREQLVPLRAQIDDTLIRGSNQASVSSKKGAKKVNKDGTEKVKRKGVAGAWSDWTKKVMIDCDAEIKAFKETAEQKSGAHLKWLSANKGKTSAEWLAFKAEWDAAHPKGAKASDAEAEESDSGSVISGGGSAAAAAPAVALPNVPVAVAAKRRGPKKLIDMTAEEKAAHAAKVAERKVKKSAGANALEEAAKAAVPIKPLSLAEVAAEAERVVTAMKSSSITSLGFRVELAHAIKDAEEAKKACAAEQATEASDAEDEDSVELKVFMVDGQKYMRPWSNSAKDWATGDLWYTNKKGEKAAYWGELMEDGSVNADAEEPQFE